jgi:hypothetical protein
MLGKRFRLTSSLPALRSVGDRQVMVTVPAGTVLTVQSDPLDDASRVQVLWKDRVVSMFPVDLLERCQAL